MYYYRFSNTKIVEGGTSPPTDSSPVYSNPFAALTGGTVVPVGGDTGFGSRDSVSFQFTADFTSTVEGLIFESGATGRGMAICCIADVLHVYTGSGGSAGVGGLTTFPGPVGSAVEVSVSMSKDSPVHCWYDGQAQTPTVVRATQDVGVTGGDIGTYDPTPTNRYATVRGIGLTSTNLGPANNRYPHSGISNPSSATVWPDVYV